MFLKEEVYSKDMCNHNLVGYVEELVNIIALKSPDTASHCIRVSMIALEIGNAFELSYEDMGELFIASTLHDIGKIYVDDTILNKPGALTAEEYEIIKGHSKKGFHMLNDIKGFDNISKIVLHHHERYDGGGYPGGLKGKEIPLSSRIIAVADSFDAMISNRRYRDKISAHEAIKELESKKSTQFDTKVTSIFSYLVKTNKIMY